MGSHWSPPSGHADAGGHVDAAPPSKYSDPNSWKGVPFKTMHRLRVEVDEAAASLAQANTLLSNARQTTGYSPKAMESLEADVRFKSAELVSLQKKLAPREANYHKAQAAKKERTRQKEKIREQVAVEKLQRKNEKSRQQATLEQLQLEKILKLQPEKKRKEMEPDPSPRGQAPVIMEPMINTATLEVALPPGGCTLTADECQYHQLDRLRRQYAHSFELFCDEMDKFGDSCLTGICLALPDMPWSITVSRLAFLFKSTLDSPGSNLISSGDDRYLSAGTTIGCEQHARYIRLPELMVIQDWRDFMRWAHHHSHLFHLCGHRSCIKLKHMCLEPLDCISSRIKCRTEHVGSARTFDQPTDEARPPVPVKCKSTGCCPPCLPRHQASNILHSVAIEFAAFHRVSFGTITSTAMTDHHAPISENQLGKLVYDEGVGLIFPFHKSYGHIFVKMGVDDSFVEVDTLLQIPSTYNSNEVQPILQKLPTWTETSFNDILNSIFWYARKRNMPFIEMDDQNRIARFHRLSPRYQCPFCHGFDNHFNSQVVISVDKIAGFDDLLEALRHMLFTHTQVPLVRKVRFLLEETRECCTIRHAWMVLLQEEYDTSITCLERGEVPPVITDLCVYRDLDDQRPTGVSKDLVAYEKKEEEVVVKESMSDTECADILDALINAVK
ncbi:hypothetical protein F4678DRAFT_466902 [Xylaria arbuscula]|nr:hypothetical protein F4678DRAFT_466902 [Xylaria arbuscula]